MASTFAVLAALTVTFVPTHIPCRLARGARSSTLSMSDEEDLSSAIAASAMADALARLDGPSFATKPVRVAPATRSSYGKRRAPSERVQRRASAPGPPQGASRGQPAPPRRRDPPQRPRRPATRNGAARSIDEWNEMVDEDGRWIEQADGMESTSFSGQLVALAPTRVMLFIDGSWLYYSMCAWPPPYRWRAGGIQASPPPPRPRLALAGPRC